MISNSPALIRLPAVLAERGIQKTQHYEDIKKGLFPGPVKIGKRAAAWPAHEVAAINRARIAGKTDEEIKILVTDLVVARSQAV